MDQISTRVTNGQTWKMDIIVVDPVFEDLRKKIFFSIEHFSISSFEGL